MQPMHVKPIDELEMIEETLPSTGRERMLIKYPYAYQFPTPPQRVGHVNSSDLMTCLQKD